MGVSTLDTVFTANYVAPVNVPEQNQLRNWTLVLPAVSAGLQSEGDFHPHSLFRKDRRNIPGICRRIHIPHLSECSRYRTNCEPAQWDRIPRWNVGCALTGCGKTPSRIGFGKGTTSVVPLSPLESVALLAPEVG